MQTQESGDRRCGIGARLRSARERSGLTPLQAAERLHLDPDVIDALETETFEALGAPVYVRGHLKRYADLVGEQAGELQQDYSQSAQAAELPDLTRIARRAPADHRLTLARIGTASVVTILVIGASWWVASALRNTAMPIAEAVIGPSRSASDDSTDVASEAPVVLRPAMPATSETNTAQRTSTSQRASTTAAADTIRPAPRMSTLTLRFAEDSWVEVYDANGKRLFYDIGSADTMRTVNGAAPLRVVLGNAPGVTVEFNGRPAIVPEFAVRDDGQARFVVNRSGRIVRSRIASGGVAQ